MEEKGKIVNVHENALTKSAKNDIIGNAQDLLSDVNAELIKKNAISMPIGELATLGAGVSSLLPVLRTVKTTTQLDMKGLFRVANASSGDVLKLAKDNSFWGAMKTANGSSKMAKLVQADSLAVSTDTVLPLNPATMMMAVALFNIEQKLGEIEDVQRQMLQSMEFDQESKIEADVEQLMSIIAKYKHNWDNDYFLASNYKMVGDIQRSSRSHINSYQKEVKAITEAKQLIVSNTKVNSTLETLLKKFKYYRLSLYSFSMASLLEIMLSGNFREDYVNGIKDEIDKMTEDYRENFERCSGYLEKISNDSIENNLTKCVGNVSHFTGKVIGSIPVINKGLVDEFLIENGEKMKESSADTERNVIRAFAEISNPRTNLFTGRMVELNHIYNHTSELCIDNDNIYLIQE